MKLNVTPYQHFKGGNYLVYGDIQPLPTGIYSSTFSFTAKESENASEIDIILINANLYYTPFSNETMTLYFSEQTGEWWVRPSGEFHGEKIHEDGSREKRFSRREEEHCVILLPQNKED